MSLKSISLAAALAGAIFLVGCGDSDSTPTNSPPVANSMAPVIIDTGADPIPFTITLGATDANGDPLSYVFDLLPPGESYQGGTVVEATSGFPDVEYTPPGSFTGVDYFTFHVNDGFIDSNGVTVYIGVDNDAPVADDQGPLTTAEDTGLPITLTGSDPNGDAITFIYSQPANGTVSGSPPDVIYTPALNYFSDPAPDSFTFVASDAGDSFTFVNDGIGTGAPATVTIDVTPVNDAPVAEDDAPQAPFETAIIIDVLGNDSDVDVGDTLSIVPAGFTQGSHGTVTHDVANDTFIYIPDAMFFGTDSFTYEITDDGAPALTDTATVWVTVENPLCDVYAWGANAETGELGIGETGDPPDLEDQDTPKKVLNITVAWQVTGGEDFTIFRDSPGPNNTIWSCGDNTLGQLGRASPVFFLDNPKTVDMAHGPDAAAGDAHALVATRDGNVKSWGSNQSGQLGDPDPNKADYWPAPTLVMTVDPLDPALVYRLTNAFAVAAGSAYSLALTRQPVHLDLAQVGAAIDNGDDTFTITVTPALLSGTDWTGGYVTNVTEGEVAYISQRVDSETVILLVDVGVTIADWTDADDLDFDTEVRVWAWGANDSGQLGLGDTDPRQFATKVTYFSDNGIRIVDIAASGSGSLGNDHTLALDDAGNVYGWGSNSRSQLGLGINICGGIYTTPQNVLTLPNPVGYGLPDPATDPVVAIAAGWEYSLALTQSGTLYGWGDNMWYQLGLPLPAPDPPHVLHRGSHYHIPWPIPVPGSEVISIAAGRDHSLAVANDHLDDVLSVDAVDNGATFTITLTTGGLGASGWEGAIVRNATAGESAWIIDHTDTTVTLQTSIHITIADWAGGDDVDIDEWYVYAWGVNTRGQCDNGPGADNPVESPTLVVGPWSGDPGQRPIKVGAGLFNSFAIILQR